MNLSAYILCCRGVYTEPTKNESIKLKPTTTTNLHWIKCILQTVRCVVTASTTTATHYFIMSSTKNNNYNALNSRNSISVAVAEAHRIQQSTSRIRFSSLALGKSENGQKQQHSHIYPSMMENLSNHNNHKY